MFRGIDHIEFYVGNAFASAYFFTHALGFRPLAEAGLETGLRDRQSFALEQGDIRLVFTNALAPDGPVAEHARVHGDGIRDVALAVDDAARAFQRCVELGAQPVAGPHMASDDSGRVRRAVVKSFGDTVHSLPNVEAARKLITSPRDRPPPAGFAPIDPSWPQRMKKGGRPRLSNSRIILPIGMPARSMEESGCITHDAAKSATSPYTRVPAGAGCPGCRPISQTPPLLAT